RSGPAPARPAAPARPDRWAPGSRTGGRGAPARRRPRPGPPAARRPAPAAAAAAGPGRSAPWTAAVPAAPARSPRAWSRAPPHHTAGTRRVRPARAGRDAGPTAVNLTRPRRIHRGPPPTITE